MFITLADFDSRWGVQARGSEGKKKKKAGRGGAGGGVRVFKRFRSHIILKSRIWSTLMFATLCVILRSRVLIIYVGAYYTRGAGSRRTCGVWGRRGRWRGGRGDE